MCVMFTKKTIITLNGTDFITSENFKNTRKKFVDNGICSDAIELSPNVYERYWDNETHAQEWIDLCTNEILDFNGNTTVISSEISNI